MKRQPRATSVCIDEQGSFFSRRPLLLRLSLSVLFVASLAIRIYHIGDPPLGFNPVRQYLHALRVRSYYYSHFDPSLPQWMKEVAQSQSQMSDVVEPPDIEGMTLLLWLLAGGIHLWLPRLLSSLFWLAGGAILYDLARRLASTDAAVLSTAFYLLLPYGVFASRTFTRDPLLVMMILLSILAIVLYNEKPSTSRVVVAGIISSAAILIKPVGLFIIFGAFVSLTLQRQGFRGAVLNPLSWVFITVAVSAAALFHGYPLLLGRTEEIGMFVRAEYLVDPASYRYWLDHIQHVVGFGALVVAALGMLLFRKGAPRALAAGLWGGYLVFGLVFIYYARTHEYYHLQLIPVIALSLGPPGSLLLGRLDQIATHWLMRAGLWSILAVAMVLALGVSGTELARQDFDDEVRIYEEVGEAVHHSTKTVYLTEDYGYPLEYYGWLAGKNWPSSARAYGLSAMSDVDAEERFLTEYAGSSPEYFIVTNLQEFQEQSDLRSLLNENFPLMVKTEDYLIYDLRNPASAGG